MIVRRYRCRDGKLIQIHTGAAGAFGRLMTVLGLEAPHLPQPPVRSRRRARSPTRTSRSSKRLPESSPPDDPPEWLEDLWRNEIAGPAGERTGRRVRRRARCATTDWCASSTTPRRAPSRWWRRPSSCPGRRRGSPPGIDRTRVSRVGNHRSRPGRHGDAHPRAAGGRPRRGAGHLLCQPLRQPLPPRPRRRRDKGGTDLG
jgi:hypothetical protein